MYCMVKMLVIKIWWIWRITIKQLTNVFCQFLQLSIEICMTSITHGDTYGLLLMVVYSLLVYRYQAYSTAVTIGCISIMNHQSPLSWFNHRLRIYLTQLFCNSPIITHKFKLRYHEDNSMPCASNRRLLSACISSQILEYACMYPVTLAPFIVNRWFSVL